MSYSLTQRSVGSLGDQPAFTPSTMLDYMRAVDAEYDLFQGSVLQSPLLLDPRMSGWTTQYAAWKAFFLNNTTGLFGGWFSRAMNTTWDRTQLFEEQLKDWRDQFRLFGGTLTSPDPSVPLGPLDQLGVAAKNATILVAVVVGSYFAIKYIPPLLEKGRR